MALLDLLGRKWALRILWELTNGPLNFRNLRSACDNLSPTVLNRRLKELNQAGIIELKSGKGYHLTREGETLLKLLAPLNEWSKNWSGRLKKESL